jgi:hypothetical protein
MMRRAVGVPGTFSQNMSASVSLAMAACCICLEITPRRGVRLIQGMVGTPWV